MQLYSDITTKNAQVIINPLSITDLYTFINNTGFKAPRGRAIIIIVIWTWDGTDYCQLLDEHKAV
jgi:hypothetical protein